MSDDFTIEIVEYLTNMFNVHNIKTIYNGNVIWQSETLSLFNRVISIYEM